MWNPQATVYHRSRYVLRFFNRVVLKAYYRLVRANSRLLFRGDNRRWTMTITRANYLIALRLIHSLSRFILKANQTNHPLTNTNLFLSVAVRAQSQLPSRHTSPRGLLPHSAIHSQLSTCPPFICIQTTTVNKPSLVVGPPHNRRRRSDVLQSDHVISGHVIRVFDTHRIHQKRFVYARPMTDARRRPYTVAKAEYTTDGVIAMHRHIIRLLLLSAVLCHLCNLSASICAQGPNELIPRMTMIHEEICYPLTLLFEKSLTEGTAANDWKRANVPPIYKKGGKSLAETIGQ